MDTAPHTDDLSIPVTSPPALASIGLVSAAIIAYEIWIMRVFAVSNWSHFGSVVISIAMFGFGVFSTVLCVARGHFRRHWDRWLETALILTGPAFLLANTVAQRLPFNPILLLSDPWQKYYLLGYFLLYLVPFLLGAMFVGLIFLRGQGEFGRVYCANMTGSGLGGLVMLPAMYFIPPDLLYALPLALWLLGAGTWLFHRKKPALLPLLILAASLAVAMGLAFEQIQVSPYKGVSYARHFPDAACVYRSQSPLGLMEVYSSRFFHFAPGLSDTAALNLSRMPVNAFLGLYLDGDGPVGIMKALPDEETEYLNFLPMSMPYLLKDRPRVFIMQFGGGISTQLALRRNAPQVTVAEGNAMIIRALRDSPRLAAFTGRVLDNPRVTLIPADGRIAIRQTAGGFDIIDFSLTDSTGLSMPAGFAITEKYAYSRETLASLIRALAPDGILALTVWNKEDPPKSTLKVMTTAVAAARTAGAGDAAPHFFIAQTYLSTLTVLYKKDGFTPDQTRALTGYCRRMSFEVVYAPGPHGIHPDSRAVYRGFRDVYFEAEGPEKPNPLNLSAGNLYAIAADSLVRGDFQSVQDQYVFNTAPLTNDRPYLGGFIKIRDIPHFVTQLESVSDEWGYLLLWAILLQSLLLGTILLLLPVIFGWRALFAPHPGKGGVILYFICLGIGYVTIEIALMGKYILCLGNPTISASVLITGLLVFSGLGSLFSSRYLDRPRRATAAAALLIGIWLAVHILWADRIFQAVGGAGYPVRVAVCLVLLLPLSFAMGFPFALGMSALARLKREHLFIWAWGINGSFSVAGTVLAPILAVLFGISATLWIAAGMYLLAVPAMGWMLRPARNRE